MTTFQLDQNIDDVKVVDACKAEGHGEANRLPVTLRDAEDPQLLAVVMAWNCALVTLDRKLPWELSAHIPEENPGIVVVTNYPRKFPTMTSRIALRLLAALKKLFPTWHEFSLRNSIVEITAEGVAVSHVQRGVIISDGYFEFSDESWLAPLQEALKRNSERGAPRLPAS